MAERAAPSSDMVERFRADFERTLGRTPDATIALAVSGGPDSMAMLVLAAAAFPGQIAAATVDHGLRRESADEAAMVAAWCEAQGLRHRTLKIEVPPGASGNLHNWARQERYLLLKRWATDETACVLCTAHHAEDQAETFLMRAARASGLAGLSAVRSFVEDSVALRELSRTETLPDGGVVFSIHRRAIGLLRPLLRWRRSELRVVAEESGAPFIDDPSNADSRFDRTRFRHWLAQAEWIDPIQIGRSAEHLAEAEADLMAISHWLWEERRRPSGDYDVRFDVAGLPRGVRRYMARMAIDSVSLINGMPIGGPEMVGNIEALLDALDAGKGATHKRVQASAKGDIWHFREAPARRPRQSL